MKYLILYMPITVETVEWANNTYPHLKQSQYSEKRNLSLLLNRALLSKALELCFNVTKLPKISYLDHGKPYFIDFPNINFNITHTNNTLAVVVADHGPVGIDIETIKVRKNFNALEKRVLTENERQWLQSQIDYLPAFFSLWSAKEAYLKATGTGLTGLSTLQLDLNEKTAYGPLQTGCLYLNTNITHESFALYLPDNLIPNIYYFNGRNIIKNEMQWICLTCQ